MFGRVMQRQNSMPSTGGLPVRLATPSSEANRRMSEVSVKVIRPRSQQQRMSYPCPPSRQSIAQTSSTISFGYASNVHQYEHSPVTKTNSTTSSSTTYADEEQASTSTFSPQPPCHPNHVEDPPTVEFYIRLPNKQVIPLFVESLSGSEADLFLQSLPERQKDRLKKFIETEPADLGEFHVWIQNDATNQITVISLKTLENHFRNQHIRRVRWRHLSLDKVSVYRYSVPVITSKFRLRLVHFMSRNYRCCILCVWCCVIFLISIGIVLTVVFGSAPQTGRNGTTIPRSGQPYPAHEAIMNRNISTANFLNYATNGGMSFQNG